MRGVGIALSLVGRWQLAQTMARTNPCWCKRYWQTTKVSVTPEDTAEHFRLRAGQATSCRAVYTFCKNLSSCFSWKVAHLQQFRAKNKCPLFYLLLLLQRLKNFALISASDRDFMQVTWGDQQWFGEQFPRPILHKEPNTVCLGSGPSLDRGAVMSIV